MVGLSREGGEINMFRIAFGIALAPLMFIAGVFLTFVVLGMLGLSADHAREPEFCQTVGFHFVGNHRC
jgi:hypothetical protein